MSIVLEFIVVQPVSIVPLVQALTGGRARVVRTVMGTDLRCNVTVNLAMQANFVTN